MATQKTPARRSIASMLPKDALLSYGKPAEPAQPSMPGFGKKKAAKKAPAKKGKR